jgi:hypothetical protein
MAFKKYKANRLELSDLEKVDGKYNVGKIVELKHPWVDKEAAEEIIEIANAEYDAVYQMANEMIDKRNDTERC